MLPRFALLRGRGKQKMRTILSHVVLHHWSCPLLLRNSRSGDSCLPSPTKRAERRRANSVQIVTGSPFALGGRRCPACIADDTGGADEGSSRCTRRPSTCVARSAVAW